MNLNATLSSLSESFTIAFADKVRQLQLEGLPIIGLQTGDPNFATPQPVISAMNEAIQRGETHYSNSRGLLELRTAIAENLQARHNIAVNPEREIIVTHGAVHAYHIALHTVINPGDHVLIPDPSWQTHANMVRILHGNPIRVPAHSENNFLPTLDDWRSALTPQTKVIVLNYPNNPTGAVAPYDYLQQINALAQEHDLYVISDEVYERLVYDDAQHTCFGSLPDALNRTLIANSFSKTYAMTGWRIGYLVAPEAVIDEALKASQHTITNVAAFIQRGAQTALTDPAVEEQVQDMIARYAKRRRDVLNVVAQNADSPLVIKPPAGAFYFFIDARQLNRPDTELSTELLESVHVALVPGSVYGSQGQGFLRMTTAASDEDVVTGIQRVLEWARQQ